jgi:hypothetical protein
LAQPAHSTAFPLSRCQVGPDGHHLHLARAGRAPAPSRTPPPCRPRTRASFLGPARPGDP